MKKFKKMLIVFFVLGSSYAFAQTPDLDVPYVPTRQAVVDAMIALAEVKPGDIHYDLGCGDGRIVITAAQKGAIGTGVDIDPQRIKEANENARAAGVTDKVTFVEGNLFDMDFSNASVLTLYLLPDVNLQLKPKILSEMKPGSRVVSHAFNMGDWEPDEKIVVEGSTLYLWVVPER